LLSINRIVPASEIRIAKKPAVARLTGFFMSGKPAPDQGIDAKNFADIARYCMFECEAVTMLTVDYF
jgi:hypothetical protein